MSLPFLWAATVCWIGPGSEILSDFIRIQVVCQDIFSAA